MNDELNIKPYKPKKRRLGPSAALMLLFVLASVILLTMEMNRRVPKPDKDIQEIAGAERIGVADSIYFNRPLYFTQKRIAPNWSMQILSRDSIFAAVNPDKPAFDQIHWLMQMCDVSGKDTLASSRIGVLKWQETPDPKNLAISLLSDVLEKHETNRNRAKILVPATLPAHHVLMGYYWAVVLPESSNQYDNVWVLSAMPRRNLTYVVLNQTRESLYEQYQPVFQDVNHGFKALSMLDKPVEYRF